MHDVPQILDTNSPTQFPAEKPGWVKTAAVITTTIGLVVLCGWTFGIDALKRLLPGLVTMKANTAAAFALSGICLYLQTLHTISPALLLVRRIAATLVSLLGLATLSEYQFGWNIGLDQLLFSEPPGEILTSHPGRMSTITATNFALIGFALLLIEARLWVAAQATALAMAMFALMPLAGYIFGNLTLTHIGDTTAIAAHTVTAFLILAAGVLAATRNHGFMTWLHRESQTIGLTASLIMLVFIFGAASYNFVQKDKASQWVEHTYKALQSMESYSDSMHDFLYHSRGFLITGDGHHLIEGNKRHEIMVAEFARMRQLVSNKPEQRERLDALDAIAWQRMEQANLIVQVRREKGFMAAATMLLGGQGEALTKEFDAKLDELRETEKSLLKERQRVAEIIRASSLFTLGVLLAASILVLLWVFRTSQREIAERRQMEEKLAQREALFRNYFDLGQIGMAITSLEHGWLRVNNRLCEMLGYPREELVKMTWIELTYPDDLEPDLVQFNKLISGEIERYSMDKRFIRKDGSLIHTYLAVSCQRKPDESPDYIIASLQDITERKRAEEDLRISEERLALATHTGNIGVWDWDVTNNILLWDNAMYRLYGLRRGDFGGAYEAWASALHPEDKTYTEGEIQAALLGEREYAPEFRVIWPDGSVHYLKAASHTLYDNNGRPLRMVGINYDLTERKQAENELREKEERLALATIQNGVGVWDWNLVTQEMIWDDSMYSLYRICREDFIGTEEAWRKALHPDDLHRGDQEVNDAIAGIKPFNTEFRVVWPSGEIHHIKAVAKVFRDERGTPLRMLGINMDITEHKQAEAALRASEERLHSIIQTSMDGIVQMDADGIVTGWNSQMEKVFGWPHTEAIGRTLHETIIPPWHREAHINGLKHFLLTGEGPALNRRIEVEGLHRDGHIFPVELTVTQIKTGDKYEFSAFLRDITEAKRVKEEIYRLNTELEQRVVERTAKLEAANKDMESFSYSISHDLRAPLRAINGFSKILQEEYIDRLDDEGRRLLHVVSDNAQKMGELIDDILAFSRAGRNEIVRSVIDMKKLTSSVWGELKPEMAGRDIYLDIGDMPHAEGDPAMIHQVVFNLLSNAVKFTQHRADARIEVCGQADEHETVYHVKDNGVGFDMQYADKLFGVFQRLHGTDEFEGTGIGLAIVKRIVTKHGGRVWAEGKVGEGAAIYFALPIDKDQGNLSSLRHSREGGNPVD